jgi:hypothetical protein
VRCQGLDPEPADYRQQGHPRSVPRSEGWYGRLGPSMGDAAAVLLLYSSAPPAGSVHEIGRGVIACAPNPYVCSAQSCPVGDPAGLAPGGHKDLFSLPPSGGHDLLRLPPGHSPAFLRLRLGLAQDLLDAPAEAIERRCAVVPRRSPSHGRHATPTTQALTGNGVVGAPAQEGRDSFGTRRAEARAGDGTDHAYRAGPCCARRSLIPRARAQSRERLGAVRVRLLPADGDDESCLVMQDIEGNEFCLD